MLLLAVGVTHVEMADLTHGLGKDLLDAIGLDSFPCESCVEIALHLEAGYWVIMAHCVLSLVINWTINLVYEAEVAEEDGVVQVEIDAPSWIDIMPTEKSDIVGNRSINV